MPSLRRFADSTRRIYAIYVPDYLATAWNAERAQGRADVPAEAKLAAVK